tara:strand:- start:937 stop:1368 length:432 start_codon:yes stop_codon:yes gene_type:complete
MFWNDYKDERGFHLYNPPTNKLTRVKNPYEIFEKIFYNDKIDNYDKLNVHEYADKYIKIVVEEKTDYYMFESLVDRLYDVGVHDIKIVETLTTEDDSDSEVNLEVKDTMTLLNEYVDETEMSVDKTELKQLMRSLYIESCEVA